MIRALDGEEERQTRIFGLYLHRFHRLFGFIIQQNREIFYRKLKRILFSVRKDNIDFSVCFPKTADLA